MASPSTALRTYVKDLFAEEFSAEGWTLADDKLVRAAGMDGQPQFAIYPDREVQNPRRALELMVTCVVQFYLPYTPEPDESIVVDPTVVEGYADRFRRMIQGNAGPGQEDLWFLHVMEISFPDDPTGNKSRFEAAVQARANNPAATPS